MKTSENMTAVFDNRIQGLIDRSPEGMAHWAGTGPEGKTCRECVHYQSTGYYSANNKIQGNRMKPGTCSRFRKMMGRKGPSFPPTTKCCRFFHENLDAPSLVSK